MRGRLIRPILAELRRFDSLGTAADPDGPGELESGFDPDFKEIVSVRSPVTGETTSARREFPAVLIPAQYEDNTYDRLQMASSGRDPGEMTVFTFHFEDLEAMGLVAPDGNALIRVGDRVTAVYRAEDEALIMKLPDPGIYCTEARPASFGLLGGDRNLLVCTFERRRTAANG